ncbi:unnamed protein product [Nyctereutes procyonoides]|uniref:(raccoon dog) hypothetical protein n=1 Tax=Nyctereutes procyonoides TaxID=34880 RepID=A0A811Z0M9_NYCPR|nr:unnamed protein product [Nyctereutes procyonoides]
MYGQHNLWDLLKYGFCTIILLLVLPPSHSATDPEFRSRFYMTETWDQGIRSRLLSTTDCQPWSIPVSSSDAIICFTYDQTHPTCQNYWVETYGGCPYRYCNIHHLGHFCQDPFTGTFATNSCWVTGVTAKLYHCPFPSYPTASLRIYRIYVQVSLPQIQSTLSPSLASLCSMGNLLHCFICAALGKGPLVDVPLPNAFISTNPTPTPPGHSLSLHDIPLFTDPLNHQFLFCYSTPNSSLYNVTQSNVISHHTPIGGFFWCNVILLSLVIGVSLASTLMATRLGTGALIHSVDSTRDLSKRLQMAIEASAEPLASLQYLLTADKGGACIFLNEERCYYISETGVVETNLHTLAKVPESLQNERIRKMSRVSVSQLLQHPYSYSHLPISEGCHKIPYSAGSSQI